MSVRNVESVDGIALSGAYRHDTGGVAKMDFSPTRYDYFSDGYSLVHHPVYDNAKDTVMAAHSRLDLTDKMGLEAMVKAMRALDQTDLVIYTMLKAHNGKFLRVSGGRIYADGDDTGNIHDYDSSYMFMIVRKDNGAYFEVMNGLDSCVVNPQTMNIEVGMRSLDEGMNLYRFGVLRYGRENRIMVYTMMNQPWGLSFDHPYVKADDGRLEESEVAIEFGTRGKYGVLDGGGTQHWIRRSGVKRFWSIYDGWARIPSPVYGERPDIVKCNGVLWGPRRTGQPSEYNPFRRDGTAFRDASNNYILTMEYGSGADEGGVLMGYDGKIRWVQYHGDLFDKFFNQTMVPKELIDSVEPNFMVDLPYETQIDSRRSVPDAPWLMDSMRQKLDVMQLKNTLTPSREFARKE